VLCERSADGWVAIDYEEEPESFARYHAALHRTSETATVEFDGTPSEREAQAWVAHHR
jgi:hypothetical protein